MQAAVRASARELAARSVPKPIVVQPNVSWSEPTQYADDETVPVSVVFDTTAGQPDSIVVEISDGTGKHQTFELQTAASAGGGGVDELLELPPASVRPGRRGGA